MRKLAFTIPSMMLAGLVPTQADAGKTSEGNQVASKSFLDKMSDVVSDISQSHKYTLAAHSSHASHASHGSHGSHRSSSYYMPPVGPDGPGSITPVSYQGGRNEMSSPRSSILPSSPAIAKKVKILPGNSGKFKEIVTRVQLALLSRGFDVGAVNGDVHARTMAAVYDYQNQHGITPSGKLTNETLGSLGLIAQ